MFRIAICFLVIFSALSHPLACAADQPQEAVSVGDDSDALVNYRYAEATNPRCGASKTVAYYAAVAGVPATLTTGGIAAALYFIPVEPVIKTAIVMMAASVASLAGSVVAATPYFVCNWSFVRHPVARWGGGGEEETDVEVASSDKHTAGTYRECSDPTILNSQSDTSSSSSDVIQRFKNGCSKEFADLDRYFACLAPKKSVDIARTLEPLCPGRKFKTTDKYAWPKNRVSSSSYIEVCYRLPVATLAESPFRSLIMQFSSGSYTDQLKESAYPREGTYGSVDMHRTKIAISGAGSAKKPEEDHVQCKALKAGETHTMYGAKFRAVERGANLCVDAVSVSGVPLLPRPEIGCHMRPNSPPVPMCDKSTTKTVDGKVVGYDNKGCYSCYIAEACKGAAGLHSKSPFPVTSVLVSCIVESLKNVLNPPTGCSGRAVAGGTGVNPGFLKVAQTKLKNSILAALVLAVILFALKAMLGGIQNPSELYMTAIKFALVVYFTQGEAMSHAYDYLTKLSIGLSDIVLQAGGNSGICDYKASEYPKDFMYLVPWDRLDCRMLFYFGNQLNGGGGATGLVLTVLLSAGLLIFAIVLNAKILLCVIAFFMVLVLIFTVIWAVYVFLLSLIALTILVVISPLMIPMCLFQVTKGFFDGWTKQLMAYSLYPVILFAFLSLMFSVFDKLYFEDLQFVQEKMKIQGVERINFKLKDSSACTGTKGEVILACALSSMRFIDRPLVLGMSVSSPEIVGNTAMLWTKMGVFVLIGFLFYHFLSSIAYIAGELAGDPRAGAIGSGSFTPKALAGKATAAASAASSFATSKIGDAVNRARGAGKGDGGSEKTSGGSEDSGGGGGSSDGKGASSSKGE